MSRLDELIQEKCPDGVEYKTLSEVFDTRNGYTPSKKEKNFWENGTIPWFRMEDIRENGGILDKATQYVSQEAVKGSPFPANSIIVATSATIGEHALITVPSIANQRFTYLMIKEQYKDDYDPKFLYYYCFKLDEYCKECLNQGNFASVDMKKFAKFQFPRLPIEIQREIVRVLDDYTENIVELQNQLTAEITARQKQYEFYRDKLLTFDVLRGGTINFCQRTLGELFDFRNGLSKGKEFFGKGTLFIRYTDVYNHRTLRKKDITALVECTEDEKERLKVSRGDVLFTRTSETAEDIGWSSVMLDDMDDCVFNGFTIKATPKTKELLPEYCAYCFSTSDFRQYVTKHCAFTTRASLTGNTIAQYRMTIPPLDIQSRIVNVLDNFEKICSDLNIGLPAEIEARQKQYEYYRDKLLTFAETGNTILSRAEQSRAEQSRAEQSRAEQSRAEQSTD